MAISLSSLASPKKRPAIVTIVAEGGMGKTTLGSMFPSPVFLRTEDGTQSIQERKDVACFPVSKSSAEVFECIASLFTEKHEFKTLVIDSITALNIMIEGEIVKADGKAKSINQAAGGYGAGYAAAANIHREIREACGALSEAKGMHIVFLAHADAESVNLPDQDEYSRYTIRMNKRSVAHYSDNVDLVGFIKLRTYVSGDTEKKKAVSDGARIITCYPVPSHISKNRFGITQDIEFKLGEFPFKGVL